MLLVVIITSSFIQIQKNEVEEYIAKAAFIYNFTKFVEWESTTNASTSFVIGVVGDSPIYEALKDLAQNKKINNKKIEIVKYNSISDMNSCQILFVPESISPKTMKEFCMSPAAKNALVISEKKGSLENCSSINFLIIDNHIKFEISLTSLNKCNLKASSQLLKLALTVQN